MSNISSRYFVTSFFSTFDFSRYLSLSFIHYIVFNVQYFFISLPNTTSPRDLDRSQKSHGGDKEIRTLDPLLARQVLSQLSYTPTPRLTFSKPMGFEN